MKILLTILMIAFLTSCTSIKVQEIASSLELSHVCIEDNPKVIVKDYIPVVRRGFIRHGITTEMYLGQLPSHCEFYLRYTALRRWDMSPYLSHAELQLYQGQRKVAYGEYHTSGGLHPSKWASVESKMDPVIDKLLAAYTPESVNAYRKILPKTSLENDEENTKSARLRELKKWYEEGLIDEKEYLAAKQKVLSEL